MESFKLLSADKKDDFKININNYRKINFLIVENCKKILKLSSICSVRCRMQYGL